jgi:hypothetical protein
VIIRGGFGSDKIFKQPLDKYPGDMVNNTWCNFSQECFSYPNKDGDMIEWERITIPPLILTSYIYPNYDGDIHD